MSIIKSVRDLFRKSDADMWYQPMGNWFNDSFVKTLGLSYGARIISDKAEQIKELRSWVYIAVEWYQREAARTDYKIYRRAKGKSVNEWPEAKLPELEKVLNNPYQPYGSYSKFMRFMAGAFELTGECLVYKQTMGNAGRILQGLSPVNPASYEPAVDQRNNEFRGWKINNKVHDKDLFAWGAYPRMDNRLRGMSVLEALSSSVDINIELQNYTAKLLKNYGIPARTLVPEQMLNAEQMKALKQWALENKGKVGDERVYPYGLKVVGEGIAPRELDFIQGRKLTKEEILAAYGVPLIMVEGKDANRATLEVATYNWLENAWYPRLAVYEEMLNSQVVWPIYGQDYWLGFDRRKIEFTEDIWKKREFEFKVGAITVNEYRESENKDPLPWGDENPTPKVGNIIGMQSPGTQTPDNQTEEQNPVSADLWLNGAQITAAVTVLQAVSAGTMAPEAAIALLVAIGIPEADARRIVTAQSQIEITPEEAAKTLTKDGKGCDHRRKEWLMFDTIAKGQEGHFASSLVRSFKRQKQKTIDNLKETYNSGAQITASIFDEDFARNDMTKVSKPFIGKAVETGYRRAEVQLSKSAKELPGNWDEDYTEKRVNNMVSKTTQTTKEKLSKLIADKSSVKAELVITLDEWIKDVSALFDDFGYRADAIASTEIVGSINWGTQSGYYDNGVQAKEWLSQQDDKVRHNEYNHLLDGTEIPLNARFATGPASALEYPGDPEGEPGDIINCRCTILPVIK